MMKKQIHKINQKFSSFIHFGGMVSEEFRSNLCDIIFYFFYDKNFNYIQDLNKLSDNKNNLYWPKLTKDLLRTFSIREISDNNYEFSFKVTGDILEWFKTNYQEIQIKSRDFNEEERILKSSENISSINLEEWETLSKNLADSYHENILFSHYPKRLAKLEKKMKSKKFSFFGMDLSSANYQQRYRKKLYYLLQQLLEDWKKSYNKRRYQKEQSLFEEKLKNFGSAINQKYSKVWELYLRLSPFFRYYGKFWDLSEGAWKNLNWDEFEKYARILTQDRDLQKLADMLGRYQEEKREYENKILEKTIIKNEWKISNSSKSEIVGVNYSSDISNVLSEELALLSNKTTEILFSKKFVERKLLTFQFAGKFLSTKEEKVNVIEKIPKQKTKGPIIACVDTSGSMEGEPARISKAVVFALLSNAIKEKRKCYLISFSTHTETVDLSKPDRFDLSGMENSITKLITFLSMGFCGGGTDAVPPFNDALTILSSEDYREADVIMISDFIMDDLNDNIKSQIREQKKKSTKFYSLTISNNKNLRALDIFDRGWLYVYTDKNAMSELIENLDSI